jgi:hypothetical protein
MRNDACGELATRDDDRDVLAFLALTTALSTPFWGTTTTPNKPSKRQMHKKRLTPGAQRRPLCHYLVGSRGQEVIHGAGGARRLDTGSARGRPQPCVACLSG